MAVLFRGTGLAWIPAKHRSVRFVDGVYSTDDADEIAVLSKYYDHEISAKADDADEVKPKRGRKPNAVRDN